MSPRRSLARRVEAGDLAHGQTGQGGDGASGVACDGDRQGTDRGGLVDHDQDPSVLGEFAEQGAQSRLAVGHRQPDVAASLTRSGSPSKRSRPAQRPVAQVADGSYEAAFEADNDHFAFSHLGGGTLNTALGMDSGTSPAIAPLPSET